MPTINKRGIDTIMSVSYTHLIPGHRVLQQRLGGHADGVQPPARQRAQHRQAAVLRCV